MTTPVVTILITVYNESTLIERAVDEILLALTPKGIAHKILIVNDGSQDWSEELEKRLLLKPNVRVKNLYPNAGKGAALSAAFGEIDTEYVILTDADCEYHASDIPQVLEKLARNEADWVQGSRYDFGRSRPNQYLATYLVNRCINLWLFLLSGKYFHDILCGLYGLRTSFVRDVRLNEKRFSYTGEFVWRLLRQKARIAQVPVGYTFRTYQGGKKIKWWETFTLIRALLKYKFKETR